MTFDFRDNTEVGKLEKLLGTTLKSVAPSSSFSAELMHGWLWVKARNSNLLSNIATSAFDHGATVTTLEWSRGHRWNIEQHKNSRSPTPQTNSGILRRKISDEPNKVGNVCNLLEEAGEGGVIKPSASSLGNGADDAARSAFSLLCCAMCITLNNCDNRHT